MTVTISQNNKAFYDYFIGEIYEVGIVLNGSEVKSLRKNRGVNLPASYVSDKNCELFLLNLHIPEYTEANRFNHLTIRTRKLLLHKREIKKLMGLITRQGMTIVPLKLYFNEKNIVKLSIATAKGKKNYDKRETIKRREWERKKNRFIENA